jgi:hypothetical protein
MILNYAIVMGESCELRVASCGPEKHKSVICNFFEDPRIGDSGVAGCTAKPINL